MPLAKTGVNLCGNVSHTGTDAMPTKRVFDGVPEAAGVEYSPNGSIPGHGLELFSNDLDWDGLLVELRQRSSAEE